LPAVLFGLFGAWLGHKLGRHSADAMVASLAHYFPGVAAQLSPTMTDLLRQWGPAAAGALVGLIAGLIAGRPLNAALGVSFRAFNRGFDLSTNAYTRSISG